MSFYSRRSKLSFLLCAFVSLCEILSPPALAAPEIRHFTPRAAIPGQRTTITFSGRNLDKASNLWTSFGAKNHRVPNTNENVVAFLVHCPPNATGIHALQLVGPEGASNFQLIMIDVLATQPHDDNHRRLETAHKITPPAAVDSVAKSEKIDYYAFTANVEQPLSIEVIAHRIGSQMDPVARVLDKSGRELVFCDDDGGTWNDPRFEFRAPADGEYILAVHDVGFGGGNSFDYRLRVTTDPLVWFTYPLADPRESGIPIEQIGAGTSRLQTPSPANPSPVSLVSTMPQLLELEPNDFSTAAQSATVPILLHGRVQSASDRDYFRFDVSPREKLIFQSQTRSAGSPCDLVLTLKDADGKTLAQSDLNSPFDAALTNQFSQAGPVFLEVRELSGYVTSNAPYRIKVQKFVPGFSLSAENNIINLKPGDSAKLKITAVRHDFTGPIQIALEQSVDGITLEQTEIPEKKNEVEIKIIAAASANPGAFYHLSLIGKNADGFSTPISTRPALRNQFPLMLNPPAALENLFVIAFRD